MTMTLGRMMNMSDREKVLTDDIGKFLELYYTGSSYDSNTMQWDYSNSKSAIEDIRVLSDLKHKNNKQLFEEVD